MFSKSLVGVRGAPSLREVNRLGCQPCQTTPIVFQCESAAVSNPINVQLSLPLWPPPEIKSPPAATGGPLSFSEGMENQNTATISPAPTPNNASAALVGWFHAVRADRRLPLSAVSIARLIQDGRTRSAVEYADDSGFSLRTIPSAIRALERTGHVIVIRGNRGLGGRGHKTRLLPVLTGGAQ